MTWGFNVFHGIFERERSEKIKRKQEVILFANFVEAEYRLSGVIDKKIDEN